MSQRINPRGPQLPQAPTGLPVGSYPTYAEAQKAVDFLSDNEFPVENCTIVGNDLRMVERVTGRLTRGRVALAGALGGGWWGLFVGLLLVLFSTGVNAFALLLFGLLSGAVFGAVTALVGYSFTGGQRDFTSTTSVVANSYDVLCQHQHAEAARGLLAKLSLRG
jgi:heat induced stress protein YflT